MPHSLIEIPFIQWPHLRDLYAAHKTSASAYNMLQVFINWIDQNPDLDVKIYSLDGDWQQDGTFIANDHSFVYCNTLSDSQERLNLALNCLDTKQAYLVAGFQERVKPTIEQHFIDAGHNKEDFKSEGTLWYHITPEQVEQLSVEPPAGITLGRLELRHADRINSIWPHRSDNSVAFVQRMIQYNDNVGAFDSEGNLMAWCLVLPLGSLGVLQVEEAHKRKGLGNLVVRQLSKFLAAKNLEVLAPVVFKNVASRSMFEKLGFQAVDKVYWAEKPAKEE